MVILAGATESPAKPADGTPASSQAAAAPTLSLDEDKRDKHAGFVTVSWKAPHRPASGLRFQLQQAPTANFADPITRYEGDQTSSVISGLPNGTYHFRVRYHAGDGWSDWSTPARFAVIHHSRRLAALLLILGVIIFGATWGFLSRASRKVSA